MRWGMRPVFPAKGLRTTDINIGCKSWSTCGFLDLTTDLHVGNSGEGPGPTRLTRSPGVRPTGLFHHADEIDRWVGGWVLCGWVSDVRMDGRTDGWMNGWMDGWCGSGRPAWWPYKPKVTTEDGLNIKIPHQERVISGNPALGQYRPDKGQSLP